MISLAYDPSHIPALGNFGVTLLHLRREAEALQIFEQIIDVSENPAELWAANHNIGRIYRERDQIQIAEIYETKAQELAAAAEQAAKEHARTQLPDNIIGRLAEAIVKTEIDFEDRE